MATENTDFKVFVGMIPRSYTTEQVRQLFIPFGTLTEVHVMLNQKGLSKGCAFIRYKEFEGAQAAIEHRNGFVLPDGVAINVRFAEHRQNETPQSLSLLAAPLQILPPPASSLIAPQTAQQQEPNLQSHHQLQPHPQTQSFSQQQQQQQQQLPSTHLPQSHLLPQEYPQSHQQPHLHAHEYSQQQTLQHQQQHHLRSQPQQAQMQHLSQEYPQPQQTHSHHQMQQPLSQTQMHSQAHQQLQHSQIDSQLQMQMQQMQIQSHPHAQARQMHSQPRALSQPHAQMHPQMRAQSHSHMQQQPPYPRQHQQQQQHQQQHQHQQYVGGADPRAVGDGTFSQGYYGGDVSDPHLSQEQFHRSQMPPRPIQQHYPPHSYDPPPVPSGSSSSYGQHYSQQQSQYDSGGGDGGSRRMEEGPDGANLFVYHLPREVTDTDLYTLFEPWGPIMSAMVFIDKNTKTSKGFGFVSFFAPEYAARAIRAMDKFHLGTKYLKVELKRSRR